MNSRLSLLLFCVGMLCVAPVAAKESNPPESFSLLDGDRVVFLGNSFFERAFEYGHLETSLAMRWPEKRITFRNLGWGGDTVYGHSRAGGRRRQVFGDPEEGFQRMTEHLKALDPSVVFVAYGFNESFDGMDGLAPFQTGLNRLLDSIEIHTNRIVLITPPAVFSDDGSVNATLEHYVKVLLATAHERGFLAVDLFGAEELRDPASRENGLHLSDAGYRLAADISARQLNLPLLRTSTNDLQVERVRKAIIKKNTLYFHRWRPRNDAFVYGERKDEQETAQKEPAQFELFIEQQELLIRKLLKS